MAREGKAFQTKGTACPKARKNGRICIQILVVQLLRDFGFFVPLGTRSKSTKRLHNSTTKIIRGIGETRGNYISVLLLTISCNLGDMISSFLFDFTWKPSSLHHTSIL